MPERFPLGEVHLTLLAFQTLLGNGGFGQLNTLLQRHRGGDFGDLCVDDRRVNEQQIRQGGRVLSSYPLPCGTVLWIVTEAGWRQTTVLVREEY